MPEATLCCDEMAVVVTSTYGLRGRFAQPRWGEHTHRRRHDWLLRKSFGPALLLRRVRGAKIAERCRGSLCGRPPYRSLAGAPPAHRRGAFFPGSLSQRRFAGVTPILTPVVGPQGRPAADLHLAGHPVESAARLALSVHLRGDLL